MASLLVGGVVTAVDRLLPAPAATPVLRSVPAATVARWGVELAQVSPPAHCRAMEAIDAPDLLNDGLGGCPVSRERAVSAAERGGSDPVLETRLARITLARVQRVRAALPVWVVVIRFDPNHMLVYGSCLAAPPGTGSCSAAPAFAGELAQIVLVDAYSAEVLLDLPVMPEGTGG
jgi:hypothetical protein